MFLLLDNYDSFTWNVYHYLASFNVKVEVYRNDKINIERIKNKNYIGIVFSPGPGKPENAGKMIDIIKEYYKNIPMLGICLGHQAIGLSFGCKIIKMNKVMHGRTDNIKKIKNNALYKGIPNELIATRYHSLEICNKNIPKEVEVFARTKKNNIMGIKIKNKNIYGLQFHPESIETMFGKKFFENFIIECMRLKK